MDTTTNNNKGGLIFLGITLVILGLFVIWGRVFTSYASVFMLGVILIGAGVIEFIQAFFKHSVGSFFLNMFMGIISIVIGGIVVFNPTVSVLTLTFFLATFLFVVGFFQFFYGLFARPLQGWTLTAGVVNVVLGLAVYNNWPVSGLTAIGWVLGLGLVVNGLLTVITGMLGSTEEETSIEQPTTSGVVRYSSEIKKPTSQD